MSRKAHADKSDWKTPQIFAFSCGYGPLKPPKDGSPMDNLLVILQEDSTSLIDMAGQAQQVLLTEQEEGHHSNFNYSAIVLMDVSKLLEAPPPDSSSTTTSTTFIKRKKLKSKNIGRTLTSRSNVEDAVEKAILRLMERLVFRKVTLMVAWGETCATILKVGLRSRKEFKHQGILAKLQLIHPILSPYFVNQWLTTMDQHSSSCPFEVQVIFAKEAAEAKRLDMLQHASPHLQSSILESCDKIGNLFYFKDAS